MSIIGALRKLYIKSCDVSPYAVAEEDKLNRFYRLWSRCYDLSVGLDPAYERGVRGMVERVVRPGDRVLDVGCGTGLGTLHAALTAGHVLGVDLSADMMERLNRKLRRDRLENVELLLGSFPDDLPPGRTFDSAISSFALVHLSSERRVRGYREIFARLEPGGRLGLFSAQGEVAKVFERREEVLADLRAVGFSNIRVEDVDDVYRIVTAEKSPVRS